MEGMIKTILRVLQLLWIVLLTALIGNVIATNVNAAASATAAVNFSMFVVVLAWIAALYGLVTSFVGAIAIPVVELALDGVTVLFTFIAGVVLAAKLTAVNCENLSFKPSDYIAFGGQDDTKRCREIQASATFMWFLFACFIGTLFFVFKAFRSGGGSARGGPSMSQIGV